MSADYRRRHCAEGDPHFFPGGTAIIEDASESKARLGDRQGATLTCSKEERNGGFRQRPETDRGQQFILLQTGSAWPFSEPGHRHYPFTMSVGKGRLRFQGEEGRDRISSRGGID